MEGKKEIFRLKMDIDLQVLQRDELHGLTVDGSMVDVSYFAASEVNKL